MMFDFPTEELASTILRRSIDKADMENLLKVTLLGREAGGEDAESASEGDGGSDRKSHSRQIAEDPFHQMAAGEFVPPRFNPNTWAQAPEQNTRLARCIRSFARNTVGLGWHIEPMHPITKQTPEAEKKVVVEQGEKLRSLFSYPNERMPLSEIFYLMKVDEEATGNGYIEVVRNNGGDIHRLYHVPATTMRVRVIVDKMWNELASGYAQDPVKILNTAFSSESYDEMVVLKDIKFYSMCEHHMLPFFGTVHFAYLPDKKVVEVSKIARLVECFARRLQIQERMTMQIGKTFEEIVSPMGVGVLVKGMHLCMTIRGVEKENATMVTSYLGGSFRDHQATREEFLRLVH